MSVLNKSRPAALLTFIVGTLFVASAGAQNHAPNPYETIEGWAKLPAGRVWGAKALFTLRVTANTSGSRSDAARIFASAATLIRSCCLTWTATWSRVSVPA